MEKSLETPVASHETQAPRDLIGTILRGRGNLFPGKQLRRRISGDRPPLYATVLRARTFSESSRESAETGLPNLPEFGIVIGASPERAWHIVRRTFERLEGQIKVGSQIAVPLSFLLRHTLGVVARLGSSLDDCVPPIRFRLQPIDRCWQK